MKAVVLTEPSHLELESIKDPDLTESEVFVRVSAAGLCHTDLNYFRDEARFQGPIILGHEVTGTVEELGSGVTSVKKGDRVIGSWVAACGKCAWCLDGQTHLCRELRPAAVAPRLERQDGSLARRATGLGAFADAMVVGEASVVKVETDLPDSHLALLGCGVATGVCAVINTAGVSPGSSVAVFGCGGVGLSCVQGAHLAGAHRVIALDPIAAKRSAAEQSGATHVVDPSDGNAVERIKELTGGRGADYVFEVSGRADTLKTAWDATRRGGTLVPVGAQAPDVQYPWPVFEQMAEEKRVLGCVYGSAEMRRDFPMLLRLMEAGRLDLDPMLSRTIALEEIPDGLLALERGEVIRQVMIP